MVVGGRQRKRQASLISADPGVTVLPVDFGWEKQLTDMRGRSRRKRSSLLSGFSMATVLTGPAASHFLLYNLVVGCMGGGVE